MSSPHSCIALVLKVAISNLYVFSVVIIRNDVLCRASPDSVAEPDHVMHCHILLFWNICKSIWKTFIWNSAVHYTYRKYTIGLNYKFLGFTFFHSFDKICLKWRVMCMTCTDLEFGRGGDIFRNRNCAVTKKKRRKWHHVFLCTENAVFCSLYYQIWSLTILVSVCLGRGRLGMLDVYESTR
jgi:hypothetical protein